VRLVVERRERLDKLLARELPELSRSRVKALIDEGHVLVDGRPKKPAFKADIGAEVVVTVPEARPLELVAEDLDLKFLHQDADVAVVYKPAGMVVHPSKGHDSGTLVHGLLHALKDLSGIGGVERPGIVHRLDKGTSGVMVVAKNDLAHASLKEQFSAHSIERRYHALVLGVPDLKAGRIDAPLGRDPRERMKQAVVEDGRPSITDWRVVERFDRATLLECTLHTGRTHQVRVHLSSLGWPILGDPLYRDRQTAPMHIRSLVQHVDHQLLHARVLGFDHPRTGEHLRFTHEAPEDFVAVLGGLRSS